MTQSSNIHPRLIGDYWWQCVVINGKLMLIQRIGRSGDCINLGAPSVKNPTGYQRV